MSLSRHTSRIYMDELDVQGALNVLSRRIAIDPPSEATPYYIGAHIVLNAISTQSDIRDQRALLQLMDRQLVENGIKPIEADETYGEKGTE